MPRVCEQPLLVRMKAPDGSDGEWEIGGVVDVMDLAKLALEAARREGHLEDLLGSEPVGEEEESTAEPPPPLGSDTPLVRSPSSVEDDCIAAAANVSCNNPTCTVSAHDTLLSVRTLRLLAVAC